MVMGDLVLLEDEVNQVMEKLRSAGFEISAVHNHLIEETPHVVYMHYMGRGPAAQLAASLKAAVAVSGKPLDKPAPAAEAATPPPRVQAGATNDGRKGTVKDGRPASRVPGGKTVTGDGLP